VPVIIWVIGGFGAGKRLNARVTRPGRDWDQAARELGMTGVDEMDAAAASRTGRSCCARTGSPRPS
jgi:hypothetical protein